MKLKSRYCKKCKYKFTPNRKSNVYCSHSCSNSSRPRIRLDPEVRFWKLVNKKGPIHPVLKTRCWIWVGSPNSKLPYGQFRIEGRDVYVHRYSWELHNDSIPEGICVLHKCDTPKCTNPNHLFLGTNQDNTDDMIQKGRKRQGPSRLGIPHTTPEKMLGESNGNVKLTEKDVRYIRKHYRRVSYRRSNSRELAAKFGVTVNCILHALKGKRWSHVK